MFRAVDDRATRSRMGRAMDDANQATTATNPPRRMFSTPASQGALFGALSGLAFGMQLSGILPTTRSGAFILWLEMRLPSLVFIAACLIAVLAFWFVERVNPTTAYDENTHRGKALLNRVMLIGAWGVPVIMFLAQADLFFGPQLHPFILMVVGVPVASLMLLTFSMPVYLFGLPGFRYRSSARFLVWTLVCVAWVCFCAAIMIELSGGNRHQGFEVQAYGLLASQVCQLLLAASFCGDPECPIYFRWLSAAVAGVVFVFICVPVFVYLPKNILDAFGYPELAVTVIGGPFMGFVTWGLMDWFAKRAAGEKG
jgi:hypothetical protein